MYPIERHPVQPEFAAKARLDRRTYDEWYRESIENPDQFFAARARELLHWFKPWDRVRYEDWSTGIARWFEGGTLNACYNCVDRQLPQRAAQTALIYEGDEPGHDQTISYQQLYEEVTRLANALKARGVQKGDVVCIYLPMIPEAAYAMLACARIGAIHSVVFGGFSPESLKDRLLDGGCVAVITADEGVRGGKSVPLKANTDKALEFCPKVHTVLTIRRTGAPVHWKKGRDLWYDELVPHMTTRCPAEPMQAEDPLFILYTSGSTGKPKGVLHSTGGYLLNCVLSFLHVFDYREHEIFWCTADVGWVTGHSYIVYGPLAAGATSLIFESTPMYPHAGRFWEVIDKWQVNIFYTAPTALRSLMRWGEAPVKAWKRTSLRVLGSVGEPINPEAWEWYFHVVGDGRCPIVDTWWQTETGSIMISALPGAIDLKPGSATLPFFGVQPQIVDSDGKVLEGACSGNLVIASTWPSQIRTVFGDHERMVATYFSTYPNKYFTGDGARRDDEGYYWITGRVDDVLNVSGHRMGTAEIESALVLHDSVAEAAVVGFPHDIKGQGIYAYVTLINGISASDDLRKELLAFVAKEIGALARPDIIQFAGTLPRTRSGKIMRRILRKIAENELANLGDTSTLADPSVLEELIANRQKITP